MNRRRSSLLYRFWLIVVVVALLGSASGAAMASPPAPLTETSISLPADANIVVEQATPSDLKTAYSKLESALAQILAAYQAGDQATLETFSGIRHVDLAQGTARVILEMDVDPQAHAVGGPTYEKVALPNGQLVTIEHAPQIAIRPDLAAAIAATGATYETAHKDWVQVLAPFGSLEALAKIDGVRYVRLPFPAEQQALPAQPATPDQEPQVGAQTTQGVNLTNINTWHSAGWDGTGVNLAVFDFGFTGWAARQTAGDLPSGGNLVQKDYSSAYAFSPDTSGYAHGTSCAEIAYDMAPASKVYLYAFGTDVEFAQAVDDYKGTGITGKKVATMSIGWVNAGPYDGTGSTSAPTTKVNEAAAVGIFWANSAGNQQQSHHSWVSSQYSGNIVRMSSGTGTDQQYEEYGQASPNYWVFPIGEVVSAYLAWNDWNTARDGNVNTDDYDIYLYEYRSWNSAWYLVASSTGNQCTNTAIPPTEAIEYAVPAACDTPITRYCLYRLQIVRYESGCNNPFGHWMTLHSFNGAYISGTGAVNLFWHYNTCNSLTIPSDSSDAVAVGASFWGEDSNATYSYGLETFSSFGPRNDSGGGNPGTTVNKPDVVAPDGVSTATDGANSNVAYRNGGGGFWGTSAAAPHVAGMAATLWEPNPSATLAAVRTYIQSLAQYKSSGGTCGGSMAEGSAPESGTQNNRYGWGRIFLNAPTAVTLADFSAVQQGDAVLLTWETNSELENRGFNLYRGTSAAGPDRQLNETLIPSQSQGNPGGFIYTWEDRADLVPGTSYFYWVEDVDIHGVATLHGPVSVDYTVPTAVTLSGIQASPAAGPALPLAGTLLALLAPLAGALAVRRRRA